MSRPATRPAPTARARKTAGLRRAKDCTSSATCAGSRSSSHCPASTDPRWPPDWARSAATPLWPEASAIERSSSLSESSWFGQPLLSLGRLLLQLALSLLEQVPALTPGLRRHARSLLPGHVGHVLSGLNAAVTQVGRLILNDVSRALLPAAEVAPLPRSGGVDAGDSSLSSGHLLDIAPGISRRPGPYLMAVAAGPSLRRSPPTGLHTKAYMRSLLREAYGVHLGTARACWPAAHRRGSAASTAGRWAQARKIGRSGAGQARPGRGNQSRRSPGRRPRTPQCGQACLPGRVSNSPSQRSWASPAARRCTVGKRLASISSDGIEQLARAVGVLERLSLLGRAGRAQAAENRSRRRACPAAAAIIRKCRYR